MPYSLGAALACMNLSTTGAHSSSGTFGVGNNNNCSENDTSLNFSNGNYFMFNTSANNSSSFQGIIPEKTIAQEILSFSNEKIHG